MSNEKVTKEHLNEEAAKESPVLRPTTQVLTHGFDPALSVGSARPAVFRSSTYVFSSPEAAERAFDLATGRAKAKTGEQPELIYSRLNHPNAEILEAQIVPLEHGASDAVVFNSGMAAIMTAMLAFLKPGQQVVYTVPVYGGTQHFIRDYLPTWGVNGIPVPAGDRNTLAEAVRSAKNLAIVLVETPANPTLMMTDIRHVCDAAGKNASGNGANRPLVFVDNTLLGPVFQHPLLLGADLVLYSATKYLSGFSDLLAGAALARNKQITEKIRLLRAMFGNILQPDECWMLDGRLPTVGLRMNHASKGAQRIAESIANHPAIARVHYPTLFDDRQQIEIFKAQCDEPGAMFSLELKGGKKSAFDFLRHLRIARNAVSLGGVETLACHPKSTTHSGFSEEEWAVAGVTDGLVRVSVGIEDWRDLLADFKQALDKAGSVS
jgi:cystathionine beta-lyase/cystathionine gamma-synthase